MKKISSDNEISEDEDEDEDDDFNEVEPSDFEDDVQAETKQYETKWGTRRQAIQVNNFNQPSGPTKVLPSRQDVKNFFELMFSNKVWYHICKQTNIYAKQRMLLNGNLLQLQSSKLGLDVSLRWV